MRSFALISTAADKSSVEGELFGSQMIIVIKNTLRIMNFLMRVGGTYEESDPQCLIHVSAYLKCLSHSTRDSLPNQLIILNINAGDSSQLVAEQP